MISYRQADILKHVAPNLKKWTLIMSINRHANPSTGKTTYSLIDIRPFSDKSAEPGKIPPIINKLHDALIDALIHAGWHTQVGKMGLHFVASISINNDWDLKGIEQRTQNLGRIELYFAADKVAEAYS